MRKRIEKSQQELQNLNQQIDNATELKKQVMVLWFGIMSAQNFKSPFIGTRRQNKPNNQRAQR